jgi:hypothetical protein
LKRSLPFIVIIISIIVLAFTVYNSFNISQPSSGKATNGFSSSEQTQQRLFPEKFGHLSIISQIEGDIAIKEIAKLHRKNIPLKDAYILEYASGNDYLRIWVSISHSKKEAKELTDRMNKLLTRTGVFQVPTVEKIDNLQVYKTLNKKSNSLNYYWADPPKVFWVETNISEKDFQSILKQVIDQL